MLFIFAKEYSVAAGDVGLEGRLHSSSPGPWHYRHHSFPVFTVPCFKSSFSFPASLNVEFLSFLRDQEKSFISLHVKAAAFSNILWTEQREGGCFTLSSLFKVPISSPWRKTENDANQYYNILHHSVKKFVWRYHIKFSIFLLLSTLHFDLCY